jgi:hypothetical protein
LKEGATVWNFAIEYDRGSHDRCLEKASRLDGSKARTMFLLAQKRRESRIEKSPNIGKRSKRWTCGQVEVDVNVP